MIVPVTRKEKLLNAIATNGNVDFSPKTREEIFLFKILGADVNAPTPITRKEILYQHIIDGSIPTFEPRTRLEKFIMVAAGAELELPVVLTREEYWWAEISDSAYETITGAIVHFISKRARAIKSLIANISYTQDLNGYSYPWPAGGGKNLFDESTIYHGYYAPDIIDRMVLDEAYRTCVLTLPAGTYTFSCDMANIYILRYAIGEQNTSVTNEQSTVTFVVSSEAVVKICFRNTGTTALTGTFHTQIESGSTATSYTPYSNICPISGWTGANVTRTGKNLIDIPASVTKDGITFTKDSDGYVTASPNSGDPRSWGKNNAQFLVNLAPGNYKFVIKLKTPSASQYSGWEIYSPTGVKIAGSSGGKFRADEVASFTASEFGNYYIMAKLHTSVSRLMVVKDGADTSNYEPYSGDTYSITFPAAAGTVYSGTLDVTTGVLTVNKVALTFNGSEGWASATANGHTRQRVNSVLVGIKQITGGGQTPNLISDRYPTKTPNATYAGTVGITSQQNSTDLYIMDNRYDYVDSASDYKTWLSTNNLKVVYELADPVTYQLTPTEVTTLVGDNTIWADTGDVTVTYNGL